MLFSKATQVSVNLDHEQAKSIYDFTAKDIDGSDVSMDKYRYENFLIIVL